MVKRATLTLDHEPEIPAPEKEIVSKPLKPEKKTIAQPKKESSSGIGKTLFVAGLTIVSLMIFKRKIF